jgi:beta-galactosidase
VRGGNIRDRASTEQAPRRGRNRRAANRAPGVTSRIAIVNKRGCHNTVLSWGAEDLKAFRIWLRHNYQTPERLNEAWGSVFWSMQVRSFDEVALPNLTVTEPTPAARLDYWRFQSQQVVAYDRMQCEIIRRHSPGRWITHNFMGFFNDFDHWQVGEHLDLAAWDSYPIGFAEHFPFADPENSGNLRLAAVSR